MIICERCGKQVPDSAAICPTCGTISPLSRPVRDGYGPGQPSSISYEYSQGYGQPSVYSPQADNRSQSEYPSPSTYPSQSGYPAQSGYPPQQSYMSPAYPPIAVNVNVVTPMPITSGNTNPGAVVAEVLLNLFLGIYGVGWMMARETTTGVIMLIASLVLYWPIVILGSIFTFGLGLLCIVPLAIGGVILNGVLLNNALKRKATYILVQTQAQIQQFPRQ